MASIKARQTGRAVARLTAVPMQLWQLDVTASAVLADGAEVKIVTGIDDHSRYCVITTAVIGASRMPFHRRSGSQLATRSRVH